MKINKNILITALILVAAVTRLLPHPVNFGPMAAIALFAGAQLGNRKWAMLTILLAAMFSDLLVNAIIYNHFSLSYFVSAGTLSIYACYLLFGLFGGSIKTATIPSVGGKAILSSLIFFLVTNFMVWMGSGMYTPDMAGLMTSYLAALPFLQNALAGDLMYSAALFGAYALVVKAEPAWLKA
jgi:hypothetical protein